MNFYVRKKIVQYALSISPSLIVTSTVGIKEAYRCSFQGFEILRRNYSSKESCLPSLPVPALQDTIQKYLKSVKPLITDDEFRITKEIATKFVALNGVGEKLQNKLLERANNCASTSENWLSAWWINTAYLDFRWPVVMWSSPGLVFPLQEFKTLDDQLNYASLVAAAAVDYKSKIDNGLIPAEMMGGQPLDMSQYQKIFGTCRIPGVTRDSIQFHSLSDKPPKHIAVAHNNHFFKVDVYGEDGKPTSYKQIFNQLRDIVDRSTHPTVPIGILSTQNRNVWGRSYKSLYKDSLNRPSIESIQKSLFLICLDGPIKNSVGCKMTDAALQCIHGNGADGNAGNRWYDKTIQFIIGKKGEVGLTYEHSPAEGPPIANLMDHIVDYIDKKQKVEDSSSVEFIRPQRLTFNVPPSGQSDIHYALEEAKTDLQSLVDDLEMTCFIFQGFGKEFIKSQGLSPDSFIQMAIQFAFYRLHKEPGAHYESASTRKFIHGRTETIRSCSEDSVDFAKKMLDDSVGVTQKVMALKSAILTHKKYAADAVNGLGIDRHLLGLKLMAIELGMDVPTLFMDVAYIRSTHMRISSSQVPAKCEAFMCYGPLVPDGYGCCYNPRKDSIVFGTSALNSSPETQSLKFKEALEQSLLDMMNVLKEDKLKSKL